MSRPFKCRQVCGQPRVVCFQPKGVSIADLEEVHLTVDEFEALRLADLESLYQEKAAAQMGVSRQTFGNIINSAHRKLADAIVNTKALKIEGGVVQFAAQGFTCPKCKHKRMAAALGSKATPECLGCSKKINLPAGPKQILKKVRSLHQMKKYPEELLT
jgi:predicted DNA-binding protein (UPF0251 family)